MADQVHKCSAKIFNGWMTPHVCGNTAKHEHDGVMYCKTHHPPTVAAKEKARSEAWKAKWARECAIREKAAAARDERDRRAALFPELLEALVDVMFRHVPFSDKSEYAEKARAVIAKSTQES